jgi:hypothetical protein
MTRFWNPTGEFLGRNQDSDEPEKVLAAAHPARDVYDRASTRICSPPAGR